MAHDYQRAVSRSADRNEPFFVHRMVWVEDRSRKHIRENSTCLIERNPVLAEVRFCFLIVPFETSSHKIELKKILLIAAHDICRLISHCQSVDPVGLHFRPSGAGRRDRNVTAEDCQNRTRTGFRYGQF